MKPLEMSNVVKTLSSLALAALPFAASGAGGANNNASREKPVPPHEPTRVPDDKGTVGDPVNAVTGAAYFRVTDVSVPCPGVPLEFARWYDSSSTSK